MTRILVLGTHNRKKGKELERLLAPYGFQLRTLADFPDAVEVVEDGDSFAANAQKKAVEQASRLGQWLIGEDSGLAVDALDGAPGIYSARYTGEDANDKSNNRYLLEQLTNTPLARRTAHYTCHITLSDPGGNVRADCEARCHGRIAMEPKGSSGFGYDPLFEVVEYHRTFGELGETVKSVLSHRSRAIAQIVPQILVLVESGEWAEGH
ncbi:MAG: RdgB/HAM1 family non-canonical purine NTP pyrophosphatase [Pirellulaceae bacterium]|nr:RdgB/HAM1 family non-canonical purine NTP pyrophosphatase [Pirellulaceae bacterium]